jgi:hypothetical protein
MSLLITSSNQVGETNAIGVATPYNYRNFLKSGLVVPPNSEIAVESVKIHRNPQLDYESGIVTNFWFGERLAANASFDNSVSYHIPSGSTCADLRAGLSPLEFTEDFANDIIRPAMSLHPEIDSTDISMTIDTDATGGFTGFLYNIPQVGTAPASVIPPDATHVQDLSLTIDTGLAAGLVNMDWSAGTFEADLADEAYAQLQPQALQGGPVSLNNGTCVFDTFANSSLVIVGVARAITSKGGGITSPSIDADDDTQGSEPGMSGFHGFWGGEFSGVSGMGDSSDLFFDYCATVSVADGLQLWHAIPVDIMGDGQGADLFMDEIVYYQKAGGAFASDNAANSSFADGSPIPSASIADVTFTFQGEKVIVSASGELVCSPIDVNASTKRQTPKPIGQTCWKMYPTVYIHDEGDTVDLSEYKCRTSSTIDKNFIDNNWNTRCIKGTYLNGNFLTGGGGSQAIPAWNNALWWPKSVDMRDVFQKQDALGAGSTLRTPKGINGSIVEDYENIIIMGESTRYQPKVIQKWQPNTMECLGFSPFAINPLSGMVTAAGGYNGASFSSATRPSMESQHSTFIRVPTLTQETYNFGTGNPSKILYQVPRFDNAGTETGALYFQNNDKTYIKLNNIAPLTVTDLDVQFVKKNEQFAKDLTGSSEVVFHIRESKL